MLQIPCVPTKRTELFRNLVFQFNVTVKSNLICGQGTCTVFFYTAILNIEKKFHLRILMENAVQGEFIPTFF